MAGGVSFDFGNTFHRFDGPPGPRSGAPSDDSRNGKLVLDHLRCGQTSQQQDGSKGKQDDSNLHDAPPLDKTNFKFQIPDSKEQLTARSSILILPPLVTSCQPKAVQ